MDDLTYEGLDKLYRRYDEIPMSDTPRTDEAEVYYSEIVTGRDAGLHWVRADFARKLEGEINELRHDLERSMTNHNADLNAAPQATAAGHITPTRGDKPAVAAPDSGFCSKCAGWRLEPGRAYGINPGSICGCR
jgi:hypothetical protein